jgi:cyclophilin family peptidyl-prolyl cis-trans isomerase/HEAT repeat protein
MRQSLAIIAVSLLAAASARGQSAASRLTTRADRDLLTRLVAAEDSRQTSLGGSDVRRRGLTARNAYLRAFTARGLGRLESPAMIPLIAPLLADPVAEVRAAAADAIAQAAARAVPGGADAAVRAASLAAADSARALLVPRLQPERDPGVRAALLEAIGRLNPGTAERVASTAYLIAPSLSASSIVERRGAIRGLFFLARKREARTAGAIPVAVTDRMFAMLGEPASAGYTPTDRYALAFALTTLNDPRMASLAADRDPQVRDRAVAALARSADTAAIRASVRQAMADTAPVVRFRSIAIYAQRLRAVSGCAPLLPLVHDRDVTVALAAIDALSGCRNDSDVSRLLDSLALALRSAGDEGSIASIGRWHRPAHALVALAAVDPSRGRALLPLFMGARDFYPRMYAEAAARALNDTAALHALARDPHPNVRSAAIESLARLVAHAADSVYVAALASTDNQLLMAAAAALKGSTAPAAREAAIAAWRRVRAMRQETMSDGESALLALIRDLGAVVDSAPVVRRAKPLPTFDDLAAIERSEARIEMADGAVIRLRFHPFDAPTNAARFVRLARAGVFDGLTFHRVAPFFVVQGPGPNANEYSAPDGPFARDELGRSNVRGTVGLSTRGRDTGDGQIFINTVDNIWLDHDYTVMASVVSGLEAFDRMQEGARIRRVTVALAGAPAGR